MGVGVKLCKPGTVDLGDCIGDVLPVARAGTEALLDLDAIRAACSESVDDVLGAITAIPLVWGSNAHYHARAGKRTIDGLLYLLLQRFGRAAANEDMGMSLKGVEPMEGDRICEAPSDNRVEAWETSLVNIGRGDVPAVSGASACLETLAPPKS